MDPATVAAGERPTDGGAPWVFQTVVNRPALMVWAAFCDLRRRAQAIQSVQPQRVNTTTLLSGRQLEASLKK
jgi:hypothetical protein